MVVYTLEEVEKIIKIPVITLRIYLKSGKLRGSKIGKHWRVTEEQLKTFMDKCANTSDMEDTI